MSGNQEKKNRENSAAVPAVNGAAANEKKKAAPSPSAGGAVSATAAKAASSRPSGQAKTPRGAGKSARPRKKKKRPADHTAANAAAARTPASPPPQAKELDYQPTRSQLDSPPPAASAASSPAKSAAGPAADSPSGKTPGPPACTDPNRRQAKTGKPVKDEKTTPASKRAETTAPAASADAGGNLPADAAVPASAPAGKKETAGQSAGAVNPPQKAKTKRQVPAASSGKKANKPAAAKQAIARKPAANKGADRPESARPLTPQEQAAQKKKKRRNVILNCLIVLCLIVMGVSGYFIWQNFHQVDAEQEVYDDLTGMLDKNETENDWHVVPNFSKLLQENEDTVGWIHLPGSPINYPVVQAEDNDFYLRRNFYRQEARSGSIFMDYTNQIAPLSRNVTLYGHNMRMSGQTMLSDLLGFEERERFDKYPYIQFDTLNGSGTWQIFSVFVYDVREIEKYNYTQANFASEEDFLAFAEHAKSLSMYDTGVEIGPGDHLLTLSTCTQSYREDNERFVVMAVLKEGALKDQAEQQAADDADDAGEQ